MPIVQIELLEGRTVEQKRVMAEKVTAAIVEALGTPPEKVSIIIRDMAKTNYATGGKLAADQDK